KQRVVTSTLEKIADAVSSAGVSSPAVLVVGDVAALHERLQWFGNKPLSGKRVFVTRTRAQAGRLSQLLREAGAEALEFPAIKIVEPTTFVILDEEVANLSRFGWIVFASQNGVDAFWRRLENAKLDTRALG